MTQEWLRDCKLIAKEITMLEEQIARLESALTGASHSFDPTGIKAHSYDNRTERVYAELEELRDRRINRIIFLEQERDRAEEMISTLPRQQQLVMKAYYFSEDDWRKVADKLGYAESHCRNIASAACKRLYERFAG